MKLDSITLELLLDTKEFITIDDINLPNNDKFVLKATYYGMHPTYNNIKVYIGILSNIEEYNNFHSITHTVILLSIESTYNKVPIEVGSIYFEYSKKYIQTQGYNVYDDIKHNTKVFSTLSKRVDLTLSKYHGTIIHQDVSFFEPNKKTYLCELYNLKPEKYKYLPSNKPSNSKIIQTGNRCIGYKK